MTIEGAPTPFQQKVLAWLTTAPGGRARISGFQISPCRGLHNRGYLRLTGSHGTWHVTITTAGRSYVEQHRLLEKLNGTVQAEK